MIVNNKKCTTQRECVLEYLKQGKQIDSDTAWKNFGIQRLSAIMYNLKHRDGFNIMSIDRKGTNRFGRSCVFSLYFLANTIEEIEQIEQRIKNGKS